MGIGASHSLFDGPATFDFLCAWACNSAIMKEKGSHELQKPVHDRGLLVQVGNCNAQKSSITRAAAIDHLYQLIQQTLADHHQNLAIDHGWFGDRNPSYLLKTFHVSGTMIENLKRKVLGEKRSSSFSSCSSFELLSAHLWKVINHVLFPDKQIFLLFLYDNDLTLIIISKMKILSLIHI